MISYIVIYRFVFILLNKNRKLMYIFNKNNRLKINFLNFLINEINIKFKLIIYIQLYNKII